MRLSLALIAIALQVFTNANDSSLDKTAPTVTITSPTSSTTYSAGTASSVTLSGTATDASGVAICRYSNALTGQSGNATTQGNGDWSVSVALTVGDNAVTVSCLDVGNNQGTDVLTVTRTASGSLTCTETLSVGTTPAQINARITANADGAVICFAAGSYTWGASGQAAIAPNIAKSVTFACVVQGGCNVTFGGNGQTGMWNTPIGTSTKLYRWTGFNFTAISTGAPIWWNHCPGGKCAETLLTSIRVDHNTFNLDGDEEVIKSDGASVQYLFGVMDHDTFNIATLTANTIIWIGTPDTSSPITRQQGSANNMYIEDSVFNVVVWKGVDQGIMDGWGTSLGVVMRFNDFLNSRTLMHDVKHGGGPSNFELYGNKYVFNANAASQNGYRTAHHQGSGTFSIWGNEWTTSVHDGATIVVQHYRSFQAPICDGTNATDQNRTPQATYQGYACHHQPGRDNDDVLFPMFSFLNRWTDNNAQVNLVLNGGGGGLPDYTLQHMVPNRDFYIENQSFTGATGVGVGPLASRPATCTTNSEAADAGRGGVLYWATDQGNWNQSTSNPHGVQRNGAFGVLYMCTATNTWTVYYTPYQYPHPLNN